MWKRTASRDKTSFGELPFIIQDSYLRIFNVQRRMGSLNFSRAPSNWYQVHDNRRHKHNLINFRGLSCPASRT